MPLNQLASPVHRIVSHIFDRFSETTALSLTHKSDQYNDRELYKRSPTGLTLVDLASTFACTLDRCQCTTGRTSVRTDISFGSDRLELVAIRQPATFTFFKLQRSRECRGTPCMQLVLPASLDHLHLPNHTTSLKGSCKTCLPVPRYFYLVARTDQISDETACHI